MTSWPQGRASVFQAFCLRSVVMRRERGAAPAGGQDERDILHRVHLSGQLDALCEGCKRLHGALAIYPRGIFCVDFEYFGRDGRHSPTVPIAQRALKLEIPLVWRQSIMQALSVLQKERVEVRQCANSIRNSIRDAAYHAAAVGGAAQHNLGEFLPLN